MKKIINIIVFALVTILLVTSNSFAIDCPDPDPNWNTGYVIYDFEQYGPGGSADFKSYSNGGIYQLKMDWTTFTKENGFISESAMKKILEIEAVRQLVPAHNYEFHCDVEVFFTSPCTMKSRLVLLLAQDGQIACCSEGFEVPEKYYTYNVLGESRQVYDVTRTIECGTKCCKRLYPCSRIYDQLLGRWVTTVGDPTTLVESGCEETLQCTPVHCLTGDPLNCNEGDCVEE